MTREQKKALVLAIEAELWRREVGLSPAWAEWYRLMRQQWDIESYWRRRDQAAEEKGR